MLKKNIKGITLLEAFLASFIFVTSVAVIFVTMNALRKPALDNERAVNGSLVLRNFLEDLREQVDSQKYAPFDSSNPTAQYYMSGGLVGNLVATSYVGPIVSMGDVNYSIFYNVTLDPVSRAKRVDAKVNWPDSL